MGKRSGAVALAVAVLAGCGGKSGRGPSAVASRTELAAQANRICQTAARQRDRVDALRRLRPSPADKELFVRWLRAEREALDAAKSLAKPSSEAPDVDPLLVLTIAEGKIAGYARRLGAEACSRVGAGRMPP
jgi:hypothetical protein